MKLHDTPAYKLKALLEPVCTEIDVAELCVGELLHFTVHDTYDHSNFSSRLPRFFNGNCTHRTDSEDMYIVENERFMLLLEYQGDNQFILSGLTK